LKWQGNLIQKLPDGVRTFHFKLEWPSLEITGAGGEQLDGNEIIRNGLFYPCADADCSNGKCLICSYSGDSNSNKVLMLFAPTDSERKEWCKLLRKHAVHHNLENGFSMTKKVLGNGAYATVYLAKDKITQQSVALKVIDRTRLNKEERLLLAEEAWISQDLKHKYLVCTHEFIENETCYVLVMDYVEGGELFERLLQHKYREDQVQRMMGQLLAGVAFMHSRRIVHFGTCTQFAYFPGTKVQILTQKALLDLKPENFLVSQDSDNKMTMKIAGTQHFCVIICTFVLVKQVLWY